MKVKRRVSIRPSSDLARDEAGRIRLGDVREGLHDVTGGAFNWPGETIGIPLTTAKILLEEGIVERVGDLPVETR